MSVNHLLEEVRKLSDEQYKEFMYAALDKTRPPEVIRAIVKHTHKAGQITAKKAKNAGIDFKGISAEGNPAEYPCQPKPSSSREESKGAFKCPFIFRTDLLPENGPVFPDVEKLSLKITEEEKLKNPNPKKWKHHTVASDIAVVNKNNDLVLWSFIKWEKSEICQTFPDITGITKEKLTIGLGLDVIKPFIEIVLNTPLIVGWGLEQDLESLRVTNKSSLKTLDLTHYFVDEAGQPYKLKDAWETFFGKTIQCGIHSAIQDARATRDLYYKYLDLKNDYPDFKLCPEKITRTKANDYKFNPNDVCKCKPANIKKLEPSRKRFYVPEK